MPVAERKGLSNDRHDEPAGCQYFRWYRGTRGECERWLQGRIARLTKEYGGRWTTAYAPCTARIVTERVAKKMRRSGVLVFENYKKLRQQGTPAFGYYWKGKWYWDTGEEV